MGHMLLVAITKQKPTPQYFERLLKPYLIKSEVGLPIDDTDLQRANWLLDETSGYKDRNGTIYVHANSGSARLLGTYKTFERWCDLPDDCEPVVVPFNTVITFQDYLRKRQGRGEAADYTKAKRRGRHCEGFTVVGRAGQVKRTYAFGRSAGKCHGIEIGGSYSGYLRSKSRTTEFGSDRYTDSYDVHAVRRDELDLEYMLDAARQWRQEFIDMCRTETGWDDKSLEAAAKLLPVFKAAYEVSLEVRAKWLHFEVWLPTQGPEGRRLVELRRWARDLPSLTETQTLQDWIDSAPPIETCHMMVGGNWFSGKIEGWILDGRDLVSEERWQHFITDTVMNMSPTSWITCLDCYVA